MIKNITLELEGSFLEYNYAPKSSSEFYNKIKKYIKSKVVVITDDTVKKFHVDNLIDKLNIEHVLVLSSPPGEKYKTFNVLLSYINNILEWGVDRSCTIICFGGGIPGNLGGLAAGLIYRGINFIHIPTTILAAFDSVISLKQAVNSNSAKNAIGLYHKPLAIYVSADFFSTLEYKEIKSGICETIKNVLAILPESISLLSNNLNDALLLKNEAIKIVKDISIEAKQIVMKYDKFEKKQALILEYGHTIGHAIELIDSQTRDDSISHGEAVGIGMLVEGEISYQMGYLNRKDLDRHYEILSKINIEPKLPKGIGVDSIIKFVKKDNKRGYIPLDENQAGIILLRELGDVLGEKNLPIVSVPIKVVEKVLQKFV